MKLSLKELLIISFIAASFLCLIINLPPFILSARNTIPGLRKTPILPLCCKFDQILHSGILSYEPSITKIKKVPSSSELYISCLYNGYITSNIYKKIPICFDSASVLSKIFSKIIKALGLQDPNKKLSLYKISKEAYGELLPSIIASSDNLVCLSVRGWILPLACRVHSLSGSNSPLLNIKWGFCSFRTSPLENGYAIDPMHVMNISIETLCKEEVEIIEIEKGKFFFPKMDESERERENTPFPKQPRSPFSSETTVITVKGGMEASKVQKLTLYVSYGLVVVSIVGAWTGIFYMICRNQRGAIGPVDPLFLILVIISTSGIIYSVLKGW